MAITKTVFDVVKDSIKPYIDLNAGNIAAVEKTSTAAAAHLAGTQIVFKGKLYDVIQDIAQNGTIIVGTNIVAADSLSSDIATLSNLVEGATEITTKAYAPVISVNDALPVNAVDVSAKIEPIQAGSGTPSPSNVRAISGRTEVTVTRAGKNLVEQTIVSASIDSTGRIVNSVETDICIAKVKKDVTYAIEFASAPFVYGFFENLPAPDSVSYNNARVVANTWTPVTAPIDGYIAFRVIKATTTKPSVEIGNVLSTAYEAPNVNDYTIQLGDTYYGGTLDVTTGVLTVDKGISTIPTITEFRTLGTTENKYMYHSINDMYLKDGSTPINDCICEKLSYIPAINGQVGYYHLSRRVYVGVTNDYTEEEFNSEIAGSKVVYPLDNPFTVQLTSQEIQMLQGNNTVFTDSGDTSIQYYANGVKNLEASVSAIQNDTNDLKALTAIFGTFENGTTASKLYAQGDYFVKNNKMCKAKTSIAKGATLTLNTNYEEFTLAEILKTIETA